MQHQLVKIDLPVDPAEFKRSMRGYLVWSNAHCCLHVGLYSRFLLYELQAMSEKSGSKIVWGFPFHTCRTQQEIVCVRHVLTYWKKRLVWFRPGLALGRACS